jgi:hypothetical protein
MNATELTVPKGDYGYNLNFTVKKADDTAFPLTGYTITLKMWKPGVPGTILTSGACVIDVAASGTCHRVVASGDFDTVGQYYAELEMTQAGIVESTDTFVLNVQESPV